MEMLSAPFATVMPVTGSTPPSDNAVGGSPLCRARHVRTRPRTPQRQRHEPEQRNPLVGYHGQPERRQDEQIVHDAHLERGYRRG